MEEDERSCGDFGGKTWFLRNNLTLSVVYVPLHNPCSGWKMFPRCRPMARTPAYLLENMRPIGYNQHIFFTGWSGLPGDSPTPTQAAGAAKSLDDLKRSILLFTRKQG